MGEDFADVAKQGDEDFTDGMKKIDEDPADLNDLGAAAKKPNGELAVATVWDIDWLINWDCISGIISI